MRDRLICAARSAWYGLSERARLRLERHRHADWYAADAAYDRIFADNRAYRDDVAGQGKPLISILLPTHNRAHLLLSRALPSVLRQTYRNFEVIVACHGCTDDTVDCVAELSDADPRLDWLEIDRRQHYPPTAENHWLAGPVDPLNAALAECRGQWIARIDDDDVWTPDHLERLLRFAQAGDYEFVSGAHRTHEGKVGPYDLDGVKVGGCQCWLYRSYLKMFRYNRFCWAKAHNRVNDTDLQDRFRKAGVRMGYLDEVVAEILPRPGEKHVGLKAYKANPDKAERLFAFD